MLFPRIFKIVGWALAIPGVILGILFQVKGYVLTFLNYNGGRRHKIYENTWENNLTDELAITLVVAGMLFIGFTKLKNESKHTRELRLRSLYRLFIGYNIAALILLLVFSEIKFGFKTSNIPLLILQNYLPFFLMVFALWFYYQFLRRKQPAIPVYLSYFPFNRIGKLFTGTASLLLIYVMVSNKHKQLGDIAEYLLLGGVLIWMSAKEKHESPGMVAMRLRALQMSVYIYCGLFIAATWLTYGLDYLFVLILSVISIQTLYLIIFYSMKHFASKPRRQIAIAKPTL